MKIVDKLICPACKSDLVRYLDKFGCSSEKCIHSKRDYFFVCVDGIPVLISELACDTVFSSSQTAPLVVRSGDGGVFRWLKKHIFGESSVTKKNILHFIRMLLKGVEKPCVLIIGSGEIGSGTTELYSSDIQLVGTDIYVSPHVNYVADAHYLPFKNKSFDGVVIQAVLEHVVDPQLVVSEIHRVLKADGMVYAETPFMQQVHEGAFDFTRYTVLGHRYLFKNFDRLDAGGLDGVGVALAWSLRAFIHAFTRSRLMAKLIFVPLKYFMTFAEKIADPRSLHDANSGSYFLGKKSKKTMTHKDIIKEYQGFKR
ncbi:class I SAM-dependent methyltransferase [Amylibacter sp.]|nr:class I SAM-dependent methyltransferase [Amylibacter sp.]